MRARLRVRIEGSALILKKEFTKEAFFFFKFLIFGIIMTYVYKLFLVLQEIMFPRLNYVAKQNVFMNEK